MCLTPDQRSALRSALAHRYGSRALLWLFGSRTVDRARGGDYDLLVQTDELDSERLIEAKLEFLAELHARPSFEGEKIDLVLYSPLLDPQPRPIHRVALESGVELT